MQRYIHALAHIAQMVEQAQANADKARDRGDSATEGYYLNELANLKALMGNWRNN